MSTKNVTVTVASVVVAQAGFINWVQGTGHTYTVAVNAQTDYITVTDDTTAAAALATHVAASDPHTGYRLESATIDTADITANAVTLAKLATQADQTFLGNVSGSTAVPVAATVAQVITALQGQVGGLPLFKPLASDFLFTTSNTALQSITGMAFTIGASATEIWWVEVFLRVLAVNTTMDMKVGWDTMPTAATMAWSPEVDGASGSLRDFRSGATGTTPGTLFSETEVPVFGSANNTTQGVHFQGWVFGGGTGGTIQFQGAQNTSNGSQLTAKAGSFLRATKVRA
jgi:hypothetical protein